MEEISNILFKSKLLGKKTDKKNDSLNSNKDNNFSSDPRNLMFYKDLTKLSYSNWIMNNIFEVFTARNHNNLLVYSTKKNSIECFDIDCEKIVTIIQDAHKKVITSIKFFFDKEQNKDKIITSSEDTSIKIWDVRTWKCLNEIKKTYRKGNLYSFTILNDQITNKNYIISSSINKFNLIRVWDFNLNFVKEIKDSNDLDTYFIDSFYDNINHNYYIITGNCFYFKSFKFVENNLYRKYEDNFTNSSYNYHYSGIVVNNQNTSKIIDTCDDNIIRIWNFHSGSLLKKILVDSFLISACLWNEKYIFVGGGDGEIKLIDFQKGEYVKSFKGHNIDVCSIKKFKLPKYGECLITQGYLKDGIKVWIIKK